MWRILEIEDSLYKMILVSANEHLKNMAPPSHRGRQPGSSPDRRAKYLAKDKAVELGDIQLQDMKESKQVTDLE